MTNKKTTLPANGLLWFGAAVSIAEIISGSLFAPLGVARGLLAIIIGHIIGGALMYGAGLIGGKTGKSAMETAQISFGSRGALLFAALNVMQLVGWTAVMIANAAAAATAILPLGGEWIWSLVIGALIAFWLVIDLQKLARVNIIAVGALFILTLILGVLLCREFGSTAPIVAETISFGAAVELSVAMPLSWLPLIADYTRIAARPRAATLVSVCIYFLGSCWMYVLGLIAAIVTGKSDVAQIITHVGLGAGGLVIVIFSTVTTTFLDTYSAGISSESISVKLKGRPVSFVVCTVGTLLAIFASTVRFESFLYLIGSVFAPMTAILLTDYYILKRNSEHSLFNMKNLMLWLIGFILYRLFMQIDLICGYTLPVMLLIALLCIISQKIMGGKTLC